MECKIDQNEDGVVYTLSISSEELRSFNILQTSIVSPFGIAGWVDKRPPIAGVEDGVLELHPESPSHLMLCAAWIFGKEAEQRMDGIDLSEFFKYQRILNDGT